MNRDHFWVTDEPFSKIEPHLPTDTRGKARVDDRRVISGIINVLRSGGRWIDAPSEYGPRKTLYNRYVRWAAKGVWVDLFHALAQAGGPPEQVLIDSSAVKAHCSASGGKGGEKPGDRSLARGTDDQNPCVDGHRVPSALVHPHRRPSGRLQSGRGTFGAASAVPNPARGQGLRLERNPQASRGARRDPQHSAQSQSQVEELLLAVPLSSTQRHRAHVLPPERLQAGGDAL